MAYNCMLFLNELLKFSQQTRELRLPYEDGFITISRAVGSLTFPANLMQVAATSPYFFRYFKDSRRKCLFNPRLIDRHMSRLNGLPSGVYATTLMREVMKVDESDVEPGPADHEAFAE